MNPAFAFPNRPGGRTVDVKEVLAHLALRVGGNVTTAWERLCFFIILFPNDGFIPGAPHQDLIQMITPHRTDAAILHLKQLQTKEEVVHMLQARIHQDVMIKGIPFMPPGFLNLPDPAFTSAINKKNGFTTLNRADFVTALICLFKGAPPKPNEEIHPALRTLIEYVNGVFDQQAFVTGSSAWRIKQGARTSTFNATTVLQAYTVQNTAVYVDSGLFKGKKFPTKAECSTLFKLLTWGKKTALKETEVPLWIYHNLGSSSFFNDLFSAAEFFLCPDALITTCPSCEQLPCMALNVPFPPYWIGSMTDGVHGPAASNRRYEAYKKCHPKFGRARVPLGDCLVLAIRCCHPGGEIVGFLPRYIPRTVEQLAVVEIPLGDDVDNYQVESEDESEEADHASDDGDAGNGDDSDAGNGDDSGAGDGDNGHNDEGDMDYDDDDDDDTSLDDLRFQ